MTKDFYNEVYKAGHATGYDGGAAGMPDRVKGLWLRTDAWLAQTGLKHKEGARILEIGCGMSYLARIHPGWHGAEYSKTAVERVKARDGAETRIFEEDAQCLSFHANSFDGIFSFAALEHVPNPDKAFREIDRVLRGGVRNDCTGLELSRLDCNQNRTAALVGT